MKKGIVGFVLMLCILLLLSNFASAQTKDKDYVQGVTKDEIIVGCSTAMTGPGAYFGVSMVQGAELYFNEVNAKGGVYGRKLKIVTEDDGCAAIKGVAAFNKLLAEKPFMLLGPACSGVALAGLETIVREGIPQITPVSSPKTFIPLRKNIFNVSTIPDNLQAMMAVDYDIHHLRARRIAIIHDASEYGKGGKDGIVARLAEYGLTPVAMEAYNAGDTDFTPHILRLKDATPEVVHLYGYIKEGAIVARQAKELGLGAQIITSTACTQPAFLESGGDAAVGVLQFYPVPYLADSPAPHIAEFIKKLKENYRMTPGRPNFTDLQGYALGMVVVEGLKKAGQSLTWEKFISALETIKDFKTGFIHPVSFSPTDHQATKIGKVLVVLPGKKWSVIADDIYVREKVEKIQ